MCGFVFISNASKYVRWPGCARTRYRSLHRSPALAGLKVCPYNNNEWQCTIPEAMQRSWPAISSCYQSIETTLFVNGVNWPHRTKVLTRKLPFPARSSVSSSLPGRTPLYDRRRHGKVPADRPNGFYLSVETEACRSAWATTPVAGQASRASISTTMGMTPPSDWCMGRQQRVWNSRTR